MQAREMRGYCNQNGNQRARNAAHDTGTKRERKWGMTYRPGQKLDEKSGPRGKEEDTEPAEKKSRVKGKGRSRSCEVMLEGKSGKEKNAN